MFHFNNETLDFLEDHRSPWEDLHEFARPKGSKNLTPEERMAQGRNADGSYKKKGYNTGNDNEYASASNTSYDKRGYARTNIQYKEVEDNQKEFYPNKNELLTRMKNIGKYIKSEKDLPYTMSIVLEDPETLNRVGITVQYARTKWVIEPTKDRNNNTKYPYKSTVYGKKSYVDDRNAHDIYTTGREDGIEDAEVAFVKMTTTFTRVEVKGDRPVLRDKDQHTFFKGDFDKVYEVVKRALDKLLSRGFVVWDAKGEVHDRIFDAYMKKNMTGIMARGGSSYTPLAKVNRQWFMDHKKFLNQVSPSGIGQSELPIKVGIAFINPETLDRCSVQYACSVKQDKQIKYLTKLEATVELQTGKMISKKVNSPRDLIYNYKNVNTNYDNIEQPYKQIERLIEKLLLSGFVVVDSNQKGFIEDLVKNYLLAHS